MHFGNLANPFFTIGHSTRPIVVFVDLLGDAGVRLIVDVRTIPRSRTNPQYHRHVLTESLSAFEIGYEHIAGLGGLRGRKRDVPPAMNAFWETELSQLRGFRHDRGLSFEPDQVTGIGTCSAVRNHVRGNSVVAMPSADAKESCIFQIS